MQMNGLVTYKTRCSPIRVVFVGITLPRWYLCLH